MDDTNALIGSKVDNVGNTFVFLHQNIRSLRQNFDTVVHLYYMS